MAGITLERLTIAGFRAYLHEQEFVLRQHATPKSLAVFAPNAKGKSSLVDALEFFFSEDGTLERLGQRRSGRQAGREALEHVRAQDEGIASTVSVAFQGQEGGFAGSRAVGANGRPRPEAAERVRRACKLDFIIRGYQLRHFVDSQEPSERYREISEWFGLSALLRIQNNLRAVRRQIRDTIDTDRATAERQRDLNTVTNGALRAWNEDAAIAWVTEHQVRPLDRNLSLASLDGSDAGYQTVRKQKEAEEKSTGLATLRRLQVVARAVWANGALEDHGAVRETGAIPAFHEAHQALSEAIHKEQEERAASERAVFKNVWEAAEPILRNADVPLTNCPVCDTPFPNTVQGSREGLALYVMRELASLQAYRDAWARLQEARQRLQRHVQELTTKLSTLTAVLEEAGLQRELMVVNTYATTLAAWEHDRASPESEHLIAVLGQLEGLLEEKIKYKEDAQGEHTWSKTLNMLDSLIALKARFDHIKRFREELQTLHSNLLEQERFIVGRMRAYGQAVIDTLKARVNEIFRAVYPDNEAPDVRLELNPDARRPELTLLFDFAPNRQGVPPSGYLSDSQIHTLALSVRLAAIQMFNKNVRLIVLDDVVTSYDADHRRAIAGMLANQFDNHQIVLVTHDERFFSYCKEQLATNKWIYKRITRIDPQRGPMFHDHKISDEIISDRHNAGQFAANEMRQAEEEWLTCVCRDVGVDVRMRDVHRPYDYSRAELAEALADFLKRKKLRPPEIPGIRNRFLNTLQTGVVENFGSHFQDDPHGYGSIGDERIRWAEFRAFRDAFRCPKCDRNRFKRPVGMARPVCRNENCEAQFSFE